MSEPLVIFDLDGVLVDTQHAENGGLAAVGALMGLTLTAERADELFSGKKMQECIDLMAELAGVEPPPDAIPLARAACEELIGDRLDPIDGVRTALAGLADAGIPMCVASNSPRELIAGRLDAAGIRPYFGERLFSAYDVDAWKPDPRLFLRAAESCGTAPEWCVVVEDSVVGVDAALAAEMTVVQYAADPAQGPHRAGVRVLTRMDAVPEAVRAHRPTRTPDELRRVEGAA
ncbi:HAD-IA family hydrolase [Streptomyces sp. NPDC041068]|uniref:HAD family hydrolase n=1 Tax=Streptomyces sp. NPDC041068 TaxID=3155130 RepID=UPI0034045BCC